MNIVTQGKSLMLAMGASPIMYLLLALSVVSIAIIVERAWFFFRLRDDVSKLARQLDTHLASGDLAGAQRKLAASPSAEAEIVLAGLSKVSAGVPAVEEAVAAAVAIQRPRLERGLAFLGTLGNNAPFVGLFGTVVGIVMAFDKLGEAGRNAATAATAAAPADVMSSIAEALVATAVGLAVALPAVAAYNYFQRTIRGILGNTDALTHVLLGFLKAEPGTGTRLSFTSDERERESPRSSRARVAEAGV